MKSFQAGVRDSGQVVSLRIAAARALASTLDSKNPLASSKR
jgi:hypothetical protein